MLQRGYMTAVAIWSLLLSNALAAPTDHPVRGIWSSLKNLGKRQNVDAPGSFSGDLGWVKKWAAVGDSYAVRRHSSFPTMVHHICARSLVAVVG